MPKNFLRNFLQKTKHKKSQLVDKFKKIFNKPFKILTGGKIRVKMFNLYQSMHRKDDQDKEKDVIGHDRFCQERPSRSSVKKKKKITRRTRSAAEFSSATLSVAHKRAAFRSNRSHSSDLFVINPTEKGPARSESFAKFLFSKRYN